MRIFVSPFRFAARVAAPFLALLPLAVPAAARETVLEDSPSRLVLEIEVPGPAAGPVEGGSRVTASGFGGASATGAPDLPWMRFTVATGDRAPGVAIEPMEWIDVAVPGGLAGVPRWITTRESEPAKDETLFAAARGLAPSLSDIRLHRGMKLREVSLPLGTYAGGETVRLLKRFRVRVDFPNPGAAPAPGVASWLEHAGVKNPRGGRYLTSIPRGAPLRRAAAGAALDPGARRLKITIGDRELDGFAEDGVYALTYSQVLAAVGSEIIGIQPGAMRLYAGPNDTLSTVMGSLLPPTLHEIPIEVRDANASLTFDAGDTILFYARGTSIWKPIPGATGPVQWEFKNDPWSFENRYYLQWDGSTSGALRLGTVAGAAASDTVNAVPHYLRAERDLATASCDLAGFFDRETGHAWFWHGRFYCNGSSAPVTLTGAQIRATSWDAPPGRVGDTTWLGMFMFEGDGGDIYTLVSNGATVPYVDEGVSGDWYRKIGNYPASGSLLESIRWGNESYSQRRFEGYTLRYVRSLQWSQGRAVFPARADGPIAYRITGVPAGLRVLRIKDGEGQRWLTVQQSGGTAVFSDSVGAGEDVRYFLHAQAPLALPASALSVEAAPASGVVENLQTGDGKDPEYLIIAPQALLPEAVQLRDYRDNAARLAPLATAVVRTEDIYREWSGGRLSPVAIRDFLRWAANRWGAGGAPGRLKHVLLFGDGHYDYRNLRNTAGFPNHVPPFNWQDNDFNPMSTDDFYAILDSGASWRSSPPFLSTGRLSFQSREQAASYAEKVARYELPATSGEWRSRIFLTGDDATQKGAVENVDPILDHTTQAEGLGNEVLALDPGMRPEKLYLFDYAHNAAWAKPEATRDLLNQYNRGVLFSTYFGHGAYNQMADEVLLKTNDGLSRLANVDKNFFMTIFSCTVGRFDKLDDEGMSEQFLRQRAYGIIGAVSGTRETYPGENENLGDAFTRNVFGAMSDTAPRMVGDALRLAKASVSSGQYYNRQKYVLQGEPAVVVHRPGLGLQLDTPSDTLRALGCDSLRGRVTRGSGRGAVNVRIVSGDVPKVYTFPVQGGGTGSLGVQKRGQILFERTVPYVDSAFSLQYFLPKQVPFGDSTAKIQIFAWDSVQLRESALLVSNLRIEGTDTAGGSCLVDDQRGPRIAVTGCNARESGEVDFPDKVALSLPYCLQIAVSDTGGGVLPGDGPDQGVTVEVVGSVAPYQPQAGVDDLYLKTYQVPLSGQQLAEGSHLLKITARDGFGNLSTRRITLQVSQDTALRFVRAFNVPNPMKRNGTTFWFSTTLPADEGGALTSANVDRVRFHVRVFNQRGYMVREFRDAVSGGTTWDGKDAWGRQLANGVYFYDVTADWSGEVTNGAPPGGRLASKRNVLVISR